MDKIHLRAMAKINLGLDVTGVRMDGYHELRMVMQTILLSDLIEIHKTSEKGVTVRTNLPYLPTDARNLAYRAAAMLADEFGISGGIAVNIRKRIPVAAGMAGGSTDAASVLYGINRLYGLGLSARALMERGLKLGADVPFCLMRGTALAEGIGELLTPLPPMMPCSILTAKPPFSVSTRYVFERLRLENSKDHPDTDQIIEALKNRELELLSGHLGNILESVTIPEWPEVGRIKTAMMENGALGALMSGSGPTVFGLFSDKYKAETAADRLRQSRMIQHVCVTAPYNKQ